MFLEAMPMFDNLKIEGRKLMYNCLAVVYSRARHDIYSFPVAGLNEQWQRLYTFSISQGFIRPQGCIGGPYERDT